LRTVAVAVAFACSLLTFVVMLAAGLFLALIQESGARGAGVLLALGAIIAFVAALLLVFARHGAFSQRSRKPLAVAIAFAAFIPVAALAYGAFTFSGVPLGSRSAAVMWAIFGTGLLLAAGALCIAVLGYLRVTEAPRPPPSRTGVGDVRITPV
jgi:hypothetical protein